MLVLSFTQFSENLNDFLLNSGISQNQISRDLGLSQSQISDWKNGKGVRLSKNAKMVSEYIETYRNSNNKQLPRSLQNTIHNFCRGSKEKYEKLERIIQALNEIT
ncbi:helix-turn-helix domain-containing protein [Planctobacterium marinum]|uniref:helix-turn-helix domain-containing protein n=1 Tax=Planctobacterium marinum TaxID=1631968 RepID=UPI00361D6A5E|nr:helix-turn-helix domain-containing protein [Planctobacterium marinum]